LFSFNFVLMDKSIARPQHWISPMTRQGGLGW